MSSHATADAAAWLPTTIVGQEAIEHWAPQHLLGPGTGDPGKGPRVLEEVDHPLVVEVAGQEASEALEPLGVGQVPPPPCGRGPERGVAEYPGHLLLRRRRPS
jgi:hypothetical protein